MKTVGELIHTLELEDVLAALNRLYEGAGESEDGYRQVWTKLQTMQPKNTSMTCLLSKGHTDPGERCWVDVSGVEPASSTLYAIEFRDWAEWLSMPIKVASELGDMPEVEQLAHCLWEMTYAGYDQLEIAERFDEICDRAEEAQAMTEAETKPN